MWEPQVEALEAAGHRALASDLPGFGDAPLEPGTIAYVDHAASLLDAPAAVVGCSFGGRIAIELAAARPDLVERLVLIGAGLGSWSWSESAQAGFAEEEEAIERGELAAAAAQQARMWLADDAAPEVRELTEAMTLRSYEQQLPVEGAGEGGLAGRRGRDTARGRSTRPRSSSSAARTSTTSRRSPRSSPPRSRARAWRRSRVPATCRASSGRPSSTRCCSTSFAEHGVRERGPGLRCPRSERRVRQRGADELPLGVDPEERRRPGLGAEMAVRAGRVQRARPVRRLAVPKLEAQPPVVRGSGGRSPAARRPGPETAPRSPRRASRARSASAPGPRGRSAACPAGFRPCPPAASPSSVASRPSGVRTASARYAGNGISVRAARCSASTT